MLSLLGSKPGVAPNGQTDTLRVPVHYDGHSPTPAELPTLGFLFALGRPQALGPSVLSLLRMLWAPTAGPQDPLAGDAPSPSGPAGSC